MLTGPWYMFSFISTVFQILYLFGTVIYLTWIFSMGYVMHSFVQSPSKPKIIYFEISFLFFVVTAITTYFVSLDALSKYLMWPLTAIETVAFFYSFGFAARMLESVKQGEIANRSDSVWTFLYIMFFPIGIWFLQPSINRILAEQESNRPGEAISEV